ncbi:PREDICTED: zinc finger BED domain-containing protein 4-like [Vollenhovia emeryi]|uniref:zinc finger BED domain-containing protein 4-like n=1 Tax=Vollenhovia emeryi TaxID=411798 RepID=UPI0005F40731|nr:PREDICTED: zinc finger BED domain-containing protein 4-like [Vollenhovia emeryi]
MIAKDNLPFRTVENEGFQYLLKTTTPLYKIPGRKSITNLMEDKYELLSMVAKLKLSTTDAVTLTTDVWTDTLNTRSYLGVTAHFVSEDKLESVTIGVTLLEERHTAEYLGEWLLQICTEWRITKEQVVAVVTDNGANILKAITDSFGKHKHLSCFAHTLNLVASKLIDEESTVRVTCDKVKALVTFFKQSVVAADELRKYTEKRLIQSVPTRWNSTYFMLDRFIELSENVGAVLLKFPQSPSMLLASELQFAKETVQVLKPVEAASREACGQVYVTPSKVIPLNTNCLRNKIKELDLLTSAGIKLRELLLANFDKRFGKVEYITFSLSRRSWTQGSKNCIFITHSRTRKQYKRLRRKCK